MSATQHFSNRKADTDPRPFKNDVNNVAALQSARLQKRRMEEAALLQQKLLNDTAEKLGNQVVDTGKVKQELEDIRKLKDILTQTVDHMSVELNKSKDDLARAMTANQETHDQMENWRRLKDGELASRNIEMENLRRQKDGELTSKNSELNNKNVELVNKNVELEKKNRELNKLKDEKEQVRDLYNKLNDEANKLRKQLPFNDQQNCLPAQYHNSIVLIMNVRSTLAIDLGKDNGAKGYGWDYTIDNENQIFHLRCTNDPPRSESPWTITRRDDGRRIFFPNGNTGTEIEVKNNVNGWEAFWYIGRGGHQGWWMFKNAAYSTYMQLENNSKISGTRIMSQHYNDCHEQNWLIVPLSFAS